LKRSTPSKQIRKYRAIRAHRSIDQELAVKEADKHPVVPAFDALCHSQEPLAEEVKEKIEAHLKTCRRCRNIATTADEYVGFFRRLMKAPIDC